MVAAKPRVLCVDDEPALLEGLVVTLRRVADVLTAASGAAGLEALGREPSVAVVVSDMRMPAMDGATFLSKSRAIVPDATRVLLTGQTDIAAAIAAINDGRIFRFLSKPCPPKTLLDTVEAAIEQHRLVTSEKVLLEQTLRGSVRMLTEVLALAAPSVFGQAMRLQRHARELAARADAAQLWPIELAAMLSQVGYISLAPATLEKLQTRARLTPEEQQALERVPALAEQFIAAIPRLEQVRAALKHHTASFDAAKDLPLGARVLKIVCDFDRLETGGLSASEALGTMRGRAGRYDPELLEQFATVVGSSIDPATVAEIPIRMVRVGMTFVDDVRSQSGALLVARGQEATESLLERFRNFAPGTVREPVRVGVKGAARAAAGS